MEIFTELISEEGEEIKVVEEKVVDVITGKTDKV